MKFISVAVLLVTMLLPVGCRPRGQTREVLSLESYRRQLEEALDEVARRIPEHARRRIEFGTNLFIAHEAWIEYMPHEALIKAVDALKEAGVDRVDINPGQYPWLEGNLAVIAKYDSAIGQIARHGLKLHLNPQYSSVKHRVKSFAQWRERAAVFYAELARRYKPHTFVVLHEPTTMAERMGQDVSIEEWVRFVREMSRVVRNHSPGSRIGVGCLASEQEYFTAFLPLKEVEVVSLDIYRLKDLRVCNRLITAARESGKPVYIEETWRPPFFNPEPGMTADIASLKNVGNRQLQELDRKWLRVMTAYAQAHGLEAITPVWIFTFFKYVDGSGDLDDPSYNREVVQAIMKGERTETFRTLQELIRENQLLEP